MRYSGEREGDPPCLQPPQYHPPLPPQYLSQDAKTVKSSPFFYIVMSFFLYLLILIRAGIVSCVYVRVVIIVVINDSSILTTGLNTTLEYLQSAPHNKTRNTWVGGQQIHTTKSEQIWTALVRSGKRSATIGTESDPLSLCIWPSPVCIPVLKPLLAIQPRPPKKPTNGKARSSQSESNDRK